MPRLRVIAGGGARLRKGTKAEQDRRVRGIVRLMMAVSPKDKRAVAWIAMLGTLSYASADERAALIKRRGRFRVVTEAMSPPPAA